MSGPHHRLGLVAIFLVALAARGGWGLMSWTRAADPARFDFPDEQQYWDMGRSLAQGRGLVDELGFRATRMPLYPAMLAPFAELPHGRRAAQVLHWGLGSLAAVLAALLAGSFDRRWAVPAGFLVACDPFLIFSSSLLLTETPFIVALTGLWILLRWAGREDSPGRRSWSWIVCGLTGLACIYLRESSLGLVGLGIAFAGWRAGGPVCGVRAAMTVGLVVVLGLAPWALRNREVTGQWCWLTYRGGISLYDGVRPDATGGSDLGDVKQSEAVRGMDEVGWDRHFRQEAWRLIREDPPRILRLAAVKLARMWNPVPNVETHRSPLSRWVAAGWTVPTFALALLGTIALCIQSGRKGVAAAVFLLMPGAYFSLLHCVFVGSVRYRLPALPMLGVLAAAGLTVLLGGRGRESRHHTAGDAARQRPSDARG